MIGDAIVREKTKSWFKDNKIEPNKRIQSVVE